MATVTRSASITSTRFTSKLTIDGEDVDVVFDGVDFTGDGYVEIIRARSVSFKNCRVYGITPKAAKSYWLKAYDPEAVIKLNFETCFFGANAANGSNKMYNLIEPQFRMANGSSFSYNYVNRNCCTHNVYNIYGADDDANIMVDGNVLEYSDGSIRIGVMDSPACVISLKDNTVLSGPDDPAWAGIVCIQAYLSNPAKPHDTTTFGNMKVVLTGNKVPSEQQYYIYQGGTLVFNDENTPTVVLDGTTVAFEDLIIV